jgi:hypothetical protein
LRRSGAKAYGLDSDFGEVFEMKRRNALRLLRLTGYGLVTGDPQIFPIGVADPTLRSGLVAPIEQ